MTRRYWQRPTLLQALDVDRVAEDRRYMHDPLTPVSPWPFIPSISASQFRASRVRGRGSCDSRRLHERITAPSYLGFARRRAPITGEGKAASTPEAMVVQTGRDDEDDEKFEDGDENVGEWE